MIILYQSEILWTPSTKNKPKQIQISHESDHIPNSIFNPSLKHDVKIKNEWENWICEIELVEYYLEEIWM